MVHIIQTDDTEELNNTDITVSEYLTDNYGTTISISEYLANNYPPKVSSRSSSPPSCDDQNKSNGPISMVPRRASSTSSENMTITMNETSMADERQKFQVLDDEEMKKARRRMKNKISAQESRRRKKEYVDALELKMKQRDQEKRLLTEKVTELEDKMRQLVDQLFQVKQSQHPNRTQNVIEDFQPKKTQTVSIGTQTGICLECYLQMPVKTLKSSSKKKDSEELRVTSPVEQYPSKYETNEDGLNSECTKHENGRRKNYVVYHDDKSERYHPFRGEYVSPRYIRYDRNRDNQMEYIIQDARSYKRRLNTSPHLSAFSARSSPIHGSKSPPMLETYSISEQKPGNTSPRSYSGTSPGSYYKHESVTPESSTYPRYSSTSSHQ